MRFKFNIAAINHYPQGNTAGYNRTYTLNRDLILANISLGYANSYRRVFSNIAHALINGQGSGIKKDFDEYRYG